MPSRLKRLPKFPSEEAERAFWEGHDSADYFDLSGMKQAVLPNLKPTSRSISVRIPESLLCELKALAGKKGVPYQSLMKILLLDGVKRERRRA
ncbi:MAG: BrnA antitoxin family protein [Planctomycetes bacterium]|nr:BrnA antitoxin family protein [Planctomycetota bacterium]